MGTVFTALLLALLAAAVYFAGRSIRRRKGCGGNCAGCSGCPNRPLPKVKSAESVPVGTVERSCLYGNAAEARGFQRHDGAVF